MESLTQLSQFVMDNPTQALTGLAIILAIFLIILLGVSIQLIRISWRYKKLMKGMDGVSMEKMLQGHIKEVYTLKEKVAALTTEARRLDTVLQTCTQRVVLTRFNAFDNTGSDLSFSLAMLDDHKNGVVLSSIYGRNDSRVYAKPVVNGQSTYFLTEEEKEVLAKAQENNSK